MWLMIFRCVCQNPVLSDAENCPTVQLFSKFALNRHLFIGQIQQIPSGAAKVDLIFLLVIGVDGNAGRFALFVKFRGQDDPCYGWRTGWLLDFFVVQSAPLYLSIYRVDMRLSANHHGPLQQLLCQFFNMLILNIILILPHRNGEPSVPKMKGLCEHAGATEAAPA